jgi:methyltransferase
MLPVTPAQIILGFVLLERLSELWISKHNTKRLIDEGAVEHGSTHYPYIVVMHAAWLVTLVMMTPPETPVDPLWLGVFVVIEAGRLWVMLSLGRFWTTRIISLPEAPLIRRGPYRFIEHPNYVVVVGEIAVVPLMFGHWEIALLFSVLNAIALYERIRSENTALADRRSLH